MAQPIHRLNKASCWVLFGLLWLITGFANFTRGDELPLARQVWRRLVHGNQVDPHPDCLVHWRGTPLALAASRLQAGCGATIWMDRRIDPTTRLDAANLSGGTPLFAALQEVATQQQWGVTRYGNVLYVGPRPTADRLLTRLANQLEQVESLPPAQRRVFQRRSAVDWPKLTEPRSLITSLLTGRGLRVDGAESIPHDRWTAMRLPPMPLTDQLTLLLAGFELDWQPTADGRAVTLFAASEPPPVTATYRLRKRSAAAEARAALGTDAQLTSLNNRLTLTGRIEQHAKLATLLATANHRATGGVGQGTASEKSRAGQREQRFTLQVKDQPAASLLKQLAKQVGLSIQIDTRAETVLASAGRIRFEVREATLDELLQAFANAAGVTLTRRDTVVSVSVGTSSNGRP